MSWKIAILKEVADDVKRLDGSVKMQITNGIKMVSQNPLPDYQGGYGKPLENKGGRDLPGLLKIKFKKSGIRVVYKIEISGNVMKIIVISMRSDDSVYDEAYKRRRKYDL